VKVSSYGPFVSGAESRVTMQVGAMLVQMLRATALQARRCVVRSEQYEQQQTTVHIPSAMHLENAEADEVVPAVRGCPVVAARTSRRRGGDWALDALSSLRRTAAAFHLPCSQGQLQRPDVTHSQKPRSSYPIPSVSLPHLAFCCITSHRACLVPHSPWSRGSSPPCCCPCAPSMPSPPSM
jgi:hypothetical protein